MLKNKTAIICVLIPLLLCFSGCQKSQPESPSKSPTTETIDDKPSYGDTFVTASIADANVLIPLLATDTSSSSINNLVYNGLVKYNKDINIVGDLAESWDVSQDNLTITFHLRKGVKFHDGVEFTAEDVLFTYQKLIDPKVLTPYRADYEIVKKAKVLDKYTFRVTYSKPFAPSLISWSMGMLPKHLLEGKDISQSPLKRHPIGTGPYKFVEWKTGDKIVLESNHDYFLGRPYIDRFVYRIIPDIATQLLELKAGSLDSMNLEPLQYANLTKDSNFNKQFQSYRYLPFSYTYLGFNLLDTKFADRRIRQAISYGIDKQEVVDGVLIGFGKIATGPYKPGTWYFNPNVNHYPYDPQRAKQLLAEAGWQDTNKDGILKKNGKPFEFTILIAQGSESNSKAAQIIQRRLKSIGIQVNIRVIEWAAFLNEHIDKKNFEAIILAWSGNLEPDIYNIWHSKAGYNFISYNSSVVDNLLEKGRHTFDQEERGKYYFQFQEALAEDQPYVFLYVPEAIPVIHSRFHGIIPAPLGIYYNFHEWYVPKTKQKYVERNGAAQKAPG